MRAVEIIETENFHDILYIFLTSVNLWPQLYIKLKCLEMFTLHKVTNGILLPNYKRKLYPLLLFYYYSYYIF